MTVSLTAIIRARPGEAETMRRALLDVVAYVKANEPDTLAYHLSQSTKDPHAFMTFERFTDRAAMDRHNTSPAVKRFFEIAKPILASAEVHIGDEIAAK
jgi:quinol monooxygenase YgiN